MADDGNGTPGMGVVLITTGVLIAGIVIFALLLILCIRKQVEKLLSKLNSLHSSTMLGP